MVDLTNRAEVLQLPSGFSEGYRIDKKRCSTSD